MVAHGRLVVGIGEGHDGEHVGEHCPFLNRSDKRCSNCLSLDRIDHAFDYCFGEYKACPVYLELLAERRVRRLCGLLTPPSSTCVDSDASGRNPHRPLVQLTVSGPHGAHPSHGSRGAHADRYAQHAAGSALVSAASGL
jgi:hypothetical protein